MKTRNAGTKKSKSTRKPKRNTSFRFPSEEGLPETATHSSKSVGQGGLSRAGTADFLSHSILILPEEFRVEAGKSKAMREGKTWVDKSE